jgi:hypothetical protein
MMPEPLGRNVPAAISAVASLVAFTTSVSGYLLAVITPAGSSP